MSFPQKIKLENRIFERAQKLQVQVHARAGRLCSSSQDSYLKALLCVYNAFFCKENLKNFCMQNELLEGLYGFKKSVTRTPLFSMKDYKFELIIGEKNA